MSELLLAEAPMPPRVERIVENVMARFGGTSPRFIDSGECNHVVIVENADPKYLIKTPKSLGFFHEETSGDLLTEFDLVHYEAHVLKLLQERKSEAPTIIPEILEENRNRSYLVLSHIPGATIDDHQARMLGEDAQADLARKLVAEVSFMAGAINPREPRFLYNKAPRTYATDRRVDLLDHCGFDPMLGVLDEIGQHALAMIAYGLRQKYRKMLLSGRDDSTIVNHNDRRPGNWTFIETAGGLRYEGTCDYGNTVKTITEREYRFVPRLGQFMLSRVAEEHFMQTGQELNVSLVKFWDRIQIACRAVRLWTKVAFVNAEKDPPAELAKLLPPERLAQLRAELERCWPSLDWREITGEISYDYSPFRLLGEQEQVELVSGK